MHLIIRKRVNEPENRGFKQSCDWDVQRLVNFNLFICTVEIARYYGKDELTLCLASIPTAIYGNSLLFKINLKLHYKYVYLFNC